MEQLILVNFEKDPDEFYNIFEFQQACDKIAGINRSLSLVVTASPSVPRAYGDKPRLIASSADTWSCSPCIRG